MKVLLGATAALLLMAAPFWPRPSSAPGAMQFHRGWPFPMARRPATTRCAMRAQRSKPGATRGAPNSKRAKPLCRACKRKRMRQPPTPQRRS